MEGNDMANFERHWDDEGGWPAQTEWLAFLTALVC